MKVDAKFELEQNILDAWHVVDDISTVYSRVDTLNQDEIMNLLLGLKSLYQIKFEKLFESFERYRSSHDHESGPDPIFDQIII